MKQRLKTWLCAHRLALGGVGLAVLTLCCLAWAGYTLHYGCKNVSEYQIVHDEYVEKQALSPIDPGVGLWQSLPLKAGSTLYGMRLNFVTYDRVAQGGYTLTLEQDGQVCATAQGDLTGLLDGAFVDVIFAAPYTVPANGSYTLRFTYQPATPEDKVGLVYGKGAQADPAMQLSDPLSSLYEQRTAALQIITNYTGSRFVLKAFAPLAALILLVMLGGWWLLFVKKAKPHVCFAFLAAGLGLVFALITPPLAGPDEYVHLAGAYDLATRVKGGPAAALIEDGSGFSALQVRACDAPYMRKDSGPIGVIAYKNMADGLFSAGNSGALTQTATVRAPVNVQPVQYLPQTLGVLLARLLGLGFYPMLLLGRLFNLAAYVALTSLALRLLPLGRQVFLAAGLLPMCLQLTATLSADGPVLGLAFLFSALCLQGAYGKQPFSWPSRVALVALAMLLAPAKAIYIVMIGLCFFIKKEKLGGVLPSRLFKLGVCAAALFAWILANGAPFMYMLRSIDVERIKLAAGPLAVLLAAGGFAWWRWGKRPGFRKGMYIACAVLVLLLAGVAVWVMGNSGEVITPEEYAASIQPNGESSYVFSVGYILTHLPQVAKLLVNTLGAQLPAYLQGLLGALPGEPIVYGLQISWSLTIGLLLVLLASCLRTVEQPTRLPAKGRWLLGAVVLGVLALILFASISWTPINSTTVFGIQGRYLLPALPLALLLLGETNLFCLRRKAAGGLSLASGGLAAAVALQSLVLFATF